MRSKGENQDNYEASSNSSRSGRVTDFDVSSSHSALDLERARQRLMYQAAVGREITDQSKNGTPHSGRSGRHIRKQKAWWKQPLAWLGGILTLSVAAIGTAFGTGVGQDLVSVAFGTHSSQAANSARSSSPSQRPIPSADRSSRQTGSGASPENPIQIESANYATPGDPTVAFGKPLDNAQVSALTNNSAAIPDWAAFIRQAVGDGGAPVGSALVKIVLHNVTKQTVLITNIQVVKECQAPLTGTLLYSPSAGATSNIVIGYDLDNQFPIAQFDPGEGIFALHGNYFAQNSIQLLPGEVDTIVINAVTFLQYCDFSFDLAVDDSATALTERVDDNGRPFTVTAATFS
jgi:hypothetical protein